MYSQCPPSNRSFSNQIYTKHFFCVLLYSTDLSTLNTTALNLLHSTSTHDSIITSRLQLYFHLHPTTNMAPFYPYISPNATNPVPTSSNLTHNVTLLTISRAPEPTYAGTVSNSSGTSLSTAAAIGILATVLFLFGGLACFVYHALVRLPRRKQILLQERRERKRRERMGKGAVDTV